MKSKALNGAQGLFRSLVKNGINTCFANPGTSEMQLIYEMGLSDDIRPVLCLQENVVTGAADGYHRMTGTPALTLLHLGVGLANGLSGMHNARKAGSGMVTIVGDNADYHQHNDVEVSMKKPISHLAEPVSDWVKTTQSPDDLVISCGQAVQIARQGHGKITTIISATNHHWGRCDVELPAMAPLPTPSVSGETVENMAALLRNGKRTAIVLGKQAVIDGLETAGKIAAACNADILTETVTTRMPRGEGRVLATPIPYIAEMSLQALSQYEQLILIGTKKPFISIAYEGKPVSKVPDSCVVFTLATADTDYVAALSDLCIAAEADNATGVKRHARAEVSKPSGELNAEAIAQSMTALMPEDCIVVDEGATIGFEIFPGTAGARRHDWLMSVSGGAIGQGLPNALGAAVACPDRKVLALQADGSGMYTNQALWSIARENCDVTIVILRNDAYAILQLELARVRKGDANDKMLSMMELDKPTIDWVDMASGMGIRGSRATTAEEFHQQLQNALAEKGPRLIEAQVAQDLTPFIEMVAPR